jgi:hypothetical protein
LAVLFGPGLTSGRAHGVVGHRSFIEPFITEDANPKDEFVIARPSFLDTGEGNEFSLGFSLERRWSETLSLALEGDWTSTRVGGGPDAEGFENPGLLLKYAFYRSAPRELILSAALEVEPPLGAAEVGAERNTVVAPMLLFAKGLGDLPTRLPYLRPLAFMGGAGFEIGTDAEVSTVLRYDFLVMYSLPYLQDHVGDLRLPWRFSRLLPVVEFNFETRINGGARTTEARFTPGLVYQGDYVQLGVAGHFPLNRAAERELDTGFLFLVDLFYEDIFSALGWRPF